MKQQVGQWVGVLMSLTLALPTWAQPSSSPTTAPLGHTPALNIATTLASLMVVLVIIVFLAWLLKRMRVAGLHQHGAGLKVVQQLAVGQRERIVLLQVGDEQMLVGITQQHISLLSKLDKPLTTEEAPSRDFATQLSQLMKKHDKK